MGHKPHDNAHDEDTPSGIKPKNYWETTPSRRARPQYDPAEVARKYLDEMERTGRLHHKHKRTQD